MLQMSVAECAAELAKNLKVDVKIVHITKIKDNSTETFDASTAMYIVAKCEIHAFEITIEYAFGRTFRDVVKMFSTSGAMPIETFLQCMKVDTVEELRAA